MAGTTVVAAVAAAAAESRNFQRGTQYLAAAIVTVGGFIAGTMQGWTSPAGPMLVDGRQYPFVVTEENVSWIAALMPLGALVGCLAMALGALDKWGRKSLLVMLTLPTVVGWQLIVKAQSVRWFYVGRLLCGFSCGSYSVVVPLYISEIASDEIRGVLGTYFQLQFAMGILYAYVAGSYFEVRDLSTVCALVPVALLCLLAVVPESPVFRLAEGNVAEARRSLRFYRGPRCDVDEELDAMRKSLVEADNDRVPLTEAFKTTPAQRGLIIGLGVMFFQQFTGINAVIFYATTIFHETGSRMGPNASTIAVGAIAVASTCASMRAVDRQGRRALLLCSAVATGACTLVIGGFFCAKAHGHDVQSSAVVARVPLVSLCAFVVTFSAGLGPVPWILVGEIFPARIKGTASSIVCMASWFFAFLVTKFFISLVSVISIYNTFWLFTLFSILGTFFVWFVVPETKGKTMAEIQVMLGADFTPL